MGSQMFDHVKTMREMEHLEIGTRVVVDGEPGAITGNVASGNFEVKFDGGGTGYCHPGWRFELEGEK